MSEYIPYNPTDTERETAEQAALDAAFAALQPLNDDQDMGRGVLTCIRAFKAARDSIKSSSAELLAQHPDCNGVSLYVSESSITCSAMFALSIGSADGVPPLSVGGMRIAALVKAAKATEALSVFESAIDVDDEFSIYTADDAIELAAKQQSEK